MTKTGFASQRMGPALKSKNLSVNTKKGDLSNANTFSFLIGNTFHVRYPSLILLGLITKGMSSARIFKLLRSPRIDSNEPIQPGCVAWRAGTTTPLFGLGS
jgi:hypothetical protein